MKIYRNEKGRWSYSFICNGRRVRKVVGLSKQECEAVACEARNKIKRDGFGIKGAAKNVYFEDFAQEFLERYSKIYKRSWSRDETSFKHLFAFFKGKYISGITRNLIEQYVAARKEAASPATVNLEIALIKKMLCKAIDWGYLEANPSTKVKKFKLNNAREKVLDAEETRRLIECADSSLRPIVIIALMSGLRKGEILNLKWSDVNFIQSYIAIERSKGGKPRKVPMNSAVRNVLKALPRFHDYVFFNPETGKHRTGIYKAFAKARARAEIRGFRFHDCRHTFATRFIESGGDIVALSKILGHASLAMTLRYCNPTEESMLRAVERVAGGIMSVGEEISGNFSAIIEKPTTISSSLLSN